VRAKGGQTTDTPKGGYFATRLRHDPNRTAVWRHICHYLERWIDSTADVVELGAGWCDFANNVTAGSVVAVDIDKTAERAARPPVMTIIADCRSLPQIADAAADVVFASNLLEHFDRSDGLRVLREALRILRPGGRLILVQPNFRLNQAEYFDDYTHITIYTDRSLADLLTSQQWHVDVVQPRFLPLSMRSRASRLTFLVPWYLRLPYRPLAGQMLIVASRP
jgi:predicted SAM-dependent methyltransferase